MSASNHSAKAPLRILVTGANGFFGARISSALSTAGHRAIAVGRAPVASPRLMSALGDSVPYHRADVSEFDALRLLAEKTKPDVIVHAAAVGVLRRQPATAYDAFRMNVLAGVEVARTAADSGAAVVWIGSAFEYAPSNVPIRESHPLEPTSLYGMAKSLGWRAFANGCVPNVKHVTLRPFQLYGPGEDAQRFVIAALLAPSGRAPNEFGDPSMKRDFVYVDDAAAAVIATAEALTDERIPSGTVLNLCTGTGTTLGDAARLAAAAAGAPSFAHSFRGKPPVAGYDPHSLIGEPSAAASTLGWRASTCIEEGFARTLGALSACGTSPHRTPPSAAS